MQKFRPQRVVLLKSFKHFDLISMVDKSENHGKLLTDTVEFIALPFPFPSNLEI